MPNTWVPQSLSESASSPSCSNSTHQGKCKGGESECRETDLAFGDFTKTCEACENGARLPPTLNFAGDPGAQTCTGTGRIHLRVMYLPQGHCGEVLRSES